MGFRGHDISTEEILSSKVPMATQKDVVGVESDRRLKDVICAYANEGEIFPFYTGVYQPIASLTF